MPQSRMLEHQNFTSLAQNEIQQSILIPENLRESLVAIASDPLLAQMMYEFLSPKNSIISEEILPAMNSGLSQVNTTIDNKIRQLEQENATNTLTQALAC